MTRWLIALAFVFIFLVGCSESVTERQRWAIETCANVVIPNWGSVGGNSYKYWDVSLSQDWPIYYEACRRTIMDCPDDFDSCDVRNTLLWVRQELEEASD